MLRMPLCGLNGKKTNMLLNEHVRSLLHSHLNTISGSYGDFEDQLRRACTIYDGLSDEQIYRIAVGMTPSTTVKT